MKKILTLLFINTALASSLIAQHSIVFPAGSMEFGGYIIGFYEYRPTFTGDPNSNYKHNTFVIDDARFSIKGWFKGGLRYHVEINTVDLVTLALNGIKDIKSNPLTEAHVSYINPYLNVKVGYMKVPFSASSILDKINSPSLARTDFTNSDYFPRRDAGIMIYKDFWHQRINAYFGIYSGMGEVITLGSGDPNGKPEYVGRLELSSSYWRDDELDRNDLAIPVVRFSGNVRYNQKTAWSGNGTSTFGFDNVRTVNGTKLSYGYDAAIKWHGFTAQFELDNANIYPVSTDPEYAELAPYHTKFFSDGGWLLQFNYYNRKARSAFSVRYDQFVLDNLSSGNAEKTITYSYNFYAYPTNLSIKIDYAYRLKETDINMKWEEDQLRAGFQYLF
jgi:hypothetical protein